MICATMDTDENEPKSSRFLWLSIAVVGVCFFVTEHSFTMSLGNSIDSAAGELAEIASGGNTARRIAFIGLALMGAGCFVFPSGHRLRNDNLLGLLVCFYIAWCGATFFWSIDPSMTMRRLIVFLCCCIGALGISRQLTMGELVRLAVVVSTLFFVIGVATELALSTFRPWSSEYRFAGTVHPNTQGLNLVTLCLSSFCLACSAKKGRIALAALFCLGFAFLVLTKSRTSCGGAILGVFAIWSLRSSLRTQLLVAVGGLGTVAAVTLVNLQLVGGIGDNVTNAMLLGRTQQNASLTGRLPLWQELGYHMRERPILGYGFDTFWTPDHIESVSAALQWGIKEAHSAYIESVLNVGLVGATTLLLGVFIATWRARQRYLATGEAGCDFFFALLIFALANGFTESGMVLPMFVPFLTACGLTRLAFTSAEVAVPESCRTLNGEKRASKPVSRFGISPIKTTPFLVNSK